MSHHESSHTIKFSITGTNVYGADTGTLELFEGSKLILKSEGFSGGLSSPAHSSPIPSGQYNIRLDIRGTVPKYDESKGDTPTGMHHFYGIEKIDTPAWQYEWGRYRAALNEPHQGMAQAYRGNFLHGKVRQGDYTHGCICERSEVILSKLWSLQKQRVVVTVVRSKP